MFERAGEAWQEWQRYRYLSGSERLVHRTLWVLLGVAVGYAAMQHVVLIHRTELFPGGAQIGDTLFWLAIGYVGAFIFYLLNIRLQLRMDRRNIYRHLAPLMSRVVGEATNLVGVLFSAAGFVPSATETTWENIEEAFRRLTPRSDGDLIDISGGRNSDGNFPKLNIVECIQHHHMARARQVNREILEFAPYLATEAMSLIKLIEERGYFQKFDEVYGFYQRGQLGDPDLQTLLAKPVFDYLLIVHRFDRYRRELLPITFRSPPYLISGSARGSDEIPLPLPRDPSA